MMKSNVKLYETIEDYAEAISSYRSSSVTFDNMKTVFAIFFCFLTTVCAGFVLTSYAAPFLATKIRWWLRTAFWCIAWRRRLRRKRLNLNLRRPRINRVALTTRPVVRPIMRINDLEMKAFRPGLLTRSIVSRSSPSKPDWPLRRVENLLCLLEKIFRLKIGRCQ